MHPGGVPEPDVQTALGRHGRQPEIRVYVRSATGHRHRIGYLGICPAATTGGGGHAPATKQHDRSLATSAGRRVSRDANASTSRNGGDSDVTGARGRRIQHGETSLAERPGGRVATDAHASTSRGGVGSTTTRSFIRALRSDPAASTEARPQVAWRTCSAAACSAATAPSTRAASAPGPAGDQEGS